MSVRAENRYKANSLIAARKRNEEVASLEVISRSRRADPNCQSTQITWADKRSVRNWMRHNSHEFQTATELAEAAAVANDFHGGDPLSDETHWIWDLAAEFVL